jgi:hypothetical protein
MNEHLKDILTAIFQEGKAEDNEIIVELSKEALAVLTNSESDNTEE